MGRLRTSTEPPSLLLQRALPKLSGVLESSREALLQSSRHLASRLKGRLQGIQGSLNALLQGHVPITFTGYFGAGPTEPIAPPPPTTPSLTQVRVGVGVAVTPTIGAAVGREWKEGLAGQPVIYKLEESWGSRWRPGNASEAEVVAELKVLRVGRSLNQLVDELKQRRQSKLLSRGGQRTIRGYGRRARWGR
ncbi:hypothetical protein VE02_10288 [Pseudogymnoascus sp. 03VT05]|nr:hypothetical protein VE02_10288 [Pseudogymnoascus sp. 03VT05]